VLGQYKGVCKDELLGGIDNNQLHTAVRENGINIITYRRTLISCENQKLYSLSYQLKPKFRDAVTAAFPQI